MKKMFLLLFVVLFAFSAVAQTKLLRHPSYHNGKVAFSYLGDIWVANEDGSNLQRLTVHKARDIYPRFSPDGKWIAFSSNRYGNYDVFVIPATGGEAKQLTFHSGNDTVVDWAPDSKHIIFQANRGRVFPGIPSLYEVSIDGGLERPLETDWGFWGGYSPDGNKLAFNRHPMVWWRKHYRGAYAADLWIMDVSQKKFTRLGDQDYKGNYFWPMYGNGDIFFVADRLPDESKIKPGSPEVLKSVNNIWKISDKGGKPVQVTHHTDGNLFFPTMSSDRRVIVYEDNFAIWKLDTQTGKATELKFNIVSDDKENEGETITVRGETEGYGLSPSTKRAAISAHGEIFTVATDQGDVQRVTQSYSRETNPEWSPDGKWIAFVSDKSGQDEVWIAKEDGTGLKQITTGATEKHAIEWAPDSKALLVSASDHKLYRYDLDKPQPTVLAQGVASNINGATFSPDGRWIAYSTLDNEMRPHVYVIPSTGGKPQHIGNDELQFAESSPRWTRDGRKIVFLAGVTQAGSAVQRRPQSQLFSVSLQKEEKALTDRGVDTEEEAVQAEREARARRPQGPPRDGGDEVAREVKIDFDGIGKRVHQISRLSDNVSSPAVSPDGHTYAFVGVADADGRPSATIYSIQEDGTQLARLVQSAPSRGEEEDTPGPGFGGGFRDLQFSRDARSLFFMDGNKLNVVELGAAPSGAPASRSAFAVPRSYERRQVNFTVHVEVDHRAERKQVFEESWRIMKHRFYDAKMHGADWDAARATFEPMLNYVADQEEMHNVILEMIGELNASHTGISATPSAEERDHLAQSRYPGFEIDSDPSGYYKVTKIYKDGPADHEYVKVHTGEFILAVEGHDLSANDNYWKFYNSPHGRKLEFLVNSKPTKEGAWTTRVEPANQAAYTTLLYEDWVAQRRAIVDKLSNGQIGYMHIRAMDAPSLRRFEREFVENHSRKALIIDQRFNPGGGIDQELLEILGQRQYQMTRGRDSIMISRPQQGFFGPMVVMQNERSTSDAEVFPDGFRTLGLGKVVGTATYGAVIGTGSYRLLDGSTIRTPGTGLYNVKGYNLENYGVPPDVYVDNLPEDFLAGRDAQLEKAVEVLQQQIKGDKTRELQAGSGK
jgi:tricorn protease